MVSTVPGTPTMHDPFPVEAGSTADALEPFQTIQFDPYVNKTFHFWHAFVRGLKPGVLYRVDGRSDLPGQRFNRNKVLIDPYSRGNSHTLWDRGSEFTPEDNVTKSMRSVIVDAFVMRKAYECLDRSVEELRFKA
jgi:pullulanase/glycogen debranching enzyme